MPVVPLSDIVDRAFEERYGVPAINIFDDLSLQTVLTAAEKVRSPLIVQTSVKTVKSIGAPVLGSMWRSMTADVEVPVTLHLDHCPDRAIVSLCLEHGWNSVLFDASELPVEENQRQTIEVVAEASRYGAQVEGEIEAITGVEDGHGSDEEAQRLPLEVALRFIEETGVHVFAPSIGNRHGTYVSPPIIDVDRVRDLVAKRPVPIALHGGSGLSRQQFEELIAEGCAKVNISTALKEVYMRSSLAFLREAEERDRWDPPSLFRHIATDISALVADLADQFGSSGKAW